MRNNILIIPGIMLMSFSIYADNTVIAAVVPATNASGVVAASTNKQINNSLTVSSPILQQADQDFNKLNELKRQSAIAAEQAKLNPVKNDNGSIRNGIGQTIATSIVIDPKGSSFATLQFIDGSTLNVEVGSKVGSYTVSNISMSGVMLSSNCKTKKCGRQILIKRAYPTPPIKQGINNNVQSQATPIFAPNGDSSVPPIISR